MLHTLDNPHSTISEMYRRIRMNIEYAGLDQKIKVFNITSTSANEAKTTTSCNLAVMYANKYEHVLLIDADLRRPNIHHKLNIKNLNGLTELMFDFSNNDYKMDNIDLKQYIQTFEHMNMIFSLDIITAGSRINNPSEFLGSNTYKSLINSLKEKYDMIIIDTAPSGIVVDGMVVSSTSEATVFVIEQNKNSIDLVKQTIENLKHAGANVIGTILTKTPVKTSIYGQYLSDYKKYNEEVAKS